MTFPTDDATLILLNAACQMNPDTGQTHLMDFLDMGARVKAQTLIEGEGTPIYLVEHEEGYAPYSPQAVISELVGEVQRLRTELSALEGKTK